MSYTRKLDRLMGKYKVQAKVGGNNTPQKLAESLKKDRDEAERSYKAELAKGQKKAERALKKLDALIAKISSKKTMDESVEDLEYQALSLLDGLSELSVETDFGPGGSF